MRPFKRLFSSLRRNFRFILLTAISLIFFQNCELQDSIQLPNLSISSKKQSNISVSPAQNVITNGGGDGNGDGYEGKLTYVRWVPDYKCQDQASSHSELILDSTKKTAQLVTNEPALCQARKQDQISMTDIQFSTFNQDLIAYKDGIYLRKKSDNTADNSFHNNMTIETWCQGDQFQVHIFKYNESENSRIAEIFFKETLGSNFKKISEIPILSTVSSGKDQIQKKLDYRLDTTNYATSELLQDFLLSVDSKKPESQSNHFYESFFSSKSSLPDMNQKNLKLSCRLAGNFDGVIWPSRILVQGKQVHDYELLQKNNMDLGFVFSADNIQSENQEVGPKKLYYLDLANEATQDLVTQFPHSSKGIQKFLLTKDKENVVYSAIESTLGFTDLFRISLDLKVKNKISSERNVSGFGVLNNFKQDPLTERIVFMESSTSPMISQGLFYLRTNTLDGNSLQKIINESGDFNQQTRSFWIDSVLNKIFFYTGFTSVQLNVFDPSSNQLVSGIDPSLFQPSMQTQAWYNTLNLSELQGPDSVNPTSTQKYLLSVVQDSILSSSKRLLRSHMDGSEAIDLGEFEKVMSLNSNGTKIILQTKKNLTFVYKYIDLDNLQTKEIPDGQTYFFNPSSDGIYFWKDRHEENGDAYLDLSYLDIASSNQHFIKTIKSQEKVVNHFQWIGDYQYLVFMMDSNLDGLNELYLMDLLHAEKDIVQISDRYYDYGGVSSFKIINDKSIVYSTKPLNPISPSLFIWTLPE